MPYYEDTAVTLYHGDCVDVLPSLDVKANLILTSPPYFNARPEYAEWSTYGVYLGFLESAFTACHQLLTDGRYLVVVASHVIVPRFSRSESSHRKAIPFDLHAILERIGFEFIDDIIWVKPQGAGNGRGRQFAVGRRPLAYKPEATTEHILVYRKETDRLIDALLDKSHGLVEGHYMPTDVWNFNPVTNDAHPAPFPYALSSEVIRLYSVPGDVVLDPMAGSGTTLRAAKDLGRKAIGVEIHEPYCELMTKRMAQEVMEMAV